MFSIILGYVKIRLNNKSEVPAIMKKPLAIEVEDYQRIIDKPYYICFCRKNCMVKAEEIL